MDSVRKMSSDAGSVVSFGAFSALDHPRPDTSLDEAPCLVGLACDVAPVSNADSQDSLQSSRSIEDAMEVCESVTACTISQSTTSAQPPPQPEFLSADLMHQDYNDRMSTANNPPGGDDLSAPNISSPEALSAAFETTPAAPSGTEPNSLDFGALPQPTDDSTAMDGFDPQMQRGPGRPRKRSLTQSDAASQQKRGPGRPPGTARKGIPSSSPPQSSPTMTTRSRESVDIHLLLSPGQHQVAVRLPPRVDIDIDIPDVRYIDLKEEARVLDELHRSGILNKPRQLKYRPLSAADSQLQLHSAAVRSSNMFEDGEDGILLIGDGPVPSSVGTSATPLPQTSPVTAPSRVLESLRASINEQFCNGGAAAPAASSVSEKIDVTSPQADFEHLSSESEDTDDESYAIRHYRSEMEERVRWEKLSKDPKFQPADLGLTPEQFMESKFWASYFSHPWQKRPSEEEWEKWDHEQAERQQRQAAQNARKARHKDRKRLLVSVDTHDIASVDDTNVEGPEYGNSSKKRKRKHGSKLARTSWVSQSMSDEYSEDINVDSLETDSSVRSSDQGPLPSSAVAGPPDASVPFAAQKITFKVGPKAPLADKLSIATPLKFSKQTALAPKSTKTQRSSLTGTSNQADKVAIAVRSRKGGVMTRGRSRKPLTAAEIRELDAEARVKQSIDSTFVWMIAPPSPSVNPSPTIIRLRRYNVAEVHSHEYLSHASLQSASSSAPSLGHSGTQGDGSDEPPVLVGLDSASLVAATDCTMAT